MIYQTNVGEGSARVVLQLPWLWLAGWLIGWVVMVMVMVMMVATRYK